MATTTNFGWETPDDTDLVKDGAAAMRTLGSAIDTSLVDLKGGTTGQVLSKASNTDMDFTWTAVDPLLILDAKGDLISATAADTPARLAVGTNGQVLTADSTASTGLKWATPATGGLSLIASKTPSGASAIDFASIASSYKHLLLTWSGLYTSNNTTSLSVRFNDDSGANYPITTVDIRGTAISDHSLTNNTSATAVTVRGTSNSFQFAWRGSLWIYDYASTTSVKRFDSFTSGRRDDVTQTITRSCYGVWNSTSAINKVSIYRDEGTGTITGVTNSIVQLWGMA